MLPILHLSASASKIDYTSGSNNATIIKVYDLSTNHYDATNVGSIYLEEYEGIKAFSFKAQSATQLVGATFPALGTSSWTMAVTHANKDMAPAFSTGGIFSVGGDLLAGRYIGLYKSGSLLTPLQNGTNDAGLPIITGYSTANKWNSYILTYNSTVQNLVLYCNDINTFVSIVRNQNMTGKYYLNSIGGFYTGGNNGLAGSYISETMVFQSCLTDDQITSLFNYFSKNLSGSTAGYSKHKTRSPVFSRTL